MKTHMDYVIKNIEAFNQDKGSGRSLLKKGKEASVCSYIEELDNSCFVCDKIADTMERYVDTIFTCINMIKNSKTFFPNAKASVQVIMDFL